MPYLIIKSKYNSNISVNMLGHFVLFIKKYIKDYICFAMKPNELSTIYSSCYVCDIFNTINNNGGINDEKLNFILDFERKYKEYTIIIVEKKPFPF